MNAKTLQGIDFSLLENFISRVGSVLKDLPDPDNIFTLDGPFLTTLLQDCNDASSVISVFQDLKALSRSLNILLHIVREGITSMRSGVLPVIYQRGLLALPIEAIEQIFEEVFAADTGACLSLSLVSKDFRNIVLQIPRLWTQLTNDNCPKHHLERNQSLEIDIKILSGEGFIPGHTKKFFHMVAPHSSRWKSFSITGFRNTPRDVFSDLANLSSAKTFSALETLHVDYKHDLLVDDDNDVVENEQDPDKDLKHFFNTWQMPALRVVKTVNFIPMLPTTSITCFRLEINNSRLYQGLYPYWSMHEITGLLRSLHSLTELSLDLLKIVFWRASEAEPVELPQLKKLMLHTEPRSDGDYDRSLEEVVEAISTPNISELVIYIKEFFLSRQLEALFPSDCLRWPFLESLDLEVCSQDDGLDDCDVPLNIAFSRLPVGLQHLRMSCDLLSPPRTLNVHKQEQEESPYPPLRTLCLGKSFDLDASFISSIKGITNAPVFESLEIVDCPEMDEEIVGDMLPKDKIFKYRCTVPRRSDFSDDGIF